MLTVPVFSALREHRPDAQIGLIGYPRTNRLAIACGLADSTRSLDDAEIAGLFSRNAPPAPALADYLRSFDTVISYLHDPDDTVRENLAESCAGRIICHSPQVTSGHAADHLCAPLTLLGIPVPGIAIPRLRLPEECARKGKKLLRPLGAAVVILHPGSGSERKNWPAAKFADLARRIHSDSQLTPVFSFGEADSAVRAALDRLAPDVKVIPTCDLAELAAILAACRGYVGNDSGITHLAAALGIPVIALLGPTDPAVWRPRGNNVSVIRAAQHTTEGLAAITVEEVLRSLDQRARRAT